MLGDPNNAYVNQISGTPGGPLMRAPGYIPAGGTLGDLPPITAPATGGGGFSQNLMGGATNPTGVSGDMTASLVGGGAAPFAPASNVASQTPTAPAAPISQAPGYIPAGMQRNADGTLAPQPNRFGMGGRLRSAMLGASGFGGSNFGLSPGLRSTLDASGFGGGVRPPGPGWRMGFGGQ
jgi:hypothetical protein